MIIVMDQKQGGALRQRFSLGRREIFVLGDFDPQSGNARGIHDPIGEDEEVFDATYERIDRCVNELINVFMSG